MRLFRKSALQKKYPLITGENTPILRIVCDEVKKITPEVKQFCKDILELMREYEGVGLAAPQINQNYRIAAVTQRDTEHTNKKGDIERKLLDEFVMINPRVLSRSDEMGISEEACLSLPKIKGDVARPESITIQYTCSKGKTHIHKATGFNARVILHEMDHLDGVLFIDKLE